MDSTNSTNGLQPQQEETSWNKSEFLTGWKGEFLRGMLFTSIVNLTFIKKDGTERKMRCTLRDDLLPAQEESASAQKKTPNPEVLAVWDLENSGWRSFRYDSVIGFVTESA